MYKIMTKLHTMRENVFAFHMVTNDQGERVEYGVATPEEAAKKAIELLARVGYEDLRIVDDKSYYIDLIYGEKPQPEPNYYTITYVNIQDYIPEAEVIEHIEEGSTVTSEITFTKPENLGSFHLIVDGIEYPSGNPDWITFSEMYQAKITITYSGITRNHEIEIVIDEI